MAATDGLAEAIGENFGEGEEHKVGSGIVLITTEERGLTDQNLD